MKTIYVEVSNILRVPFMTGIQRVVSEIVMRLIANQRNGDYKLVLLYNERDLNFRICNNNQFLAHFAFGHGRRTSCVTSATISLDHLEPSAFWLDLDAGWAGTVPRAVLYPQLTKRNIEIGTYVYDVIVITHPWYTSKENLIRFPTYIAAVLKYSDYIFTEAKATCEQIKQLAKETGCNRNIRYVIATPGANFQERSKSEDDLPNNIRQICERGRLLLTVSTIEARKNHKVLLDAFDRGLSQMGYQMVFVGRAGWKVDELMQRIKNHPENGKTLFQLQGIDDNSLRYLYEHAAFVLFPSYTEGYGLATVEALQNGIPPILSDVPIMREVGGELCEYFDPDSPEQLVNIVRKYDEDPELYKVWKERIAEYTPPTWDTCAGVILDAVLNSRRPMPREHKLEQIVYLSARADDLLRTLPYVERFMPFIKRAVLLCPEFMAKEMAERYDGKLKITYITDDDLLQGRPLPEDHSVRNYFLRCLSMFRPEIDEEFIMSDDDYRPMEMVDETFFIKDGRYQAYYFYDLDMWMNNVVIPTPYDYCMMKSNGFLTKNGYPNLQYASHMPQVMRKKWYCDLLRKYPGIESTGCDEWATYFNYAVKTHPESFDVQPYIAMSWPEMISSWDPMVIPREFRFENYYDFLYEEGRQFSGMSTELYEGTYFENAKKSIISRNQLTRSSVVQRQWRTFENKCNTAFGQFPSFVFCYGEGIEPAFRGLPPHLEMLNASVYSLPALLMKRGEDGSWKPSEEDVRIGFSWSDMDNMVIAENVNGRGTAVIRTGTPAEAKMGVLTLYYSINGGDFAQACSLTVNLKK